MRNVLSKIWIPALLIAAAAVQSYGIDAGRMRNSAAWPYFSDSTSAVTDSTYLSIPDTVIAEDTLPHAVADSAQETDSLTLVMADSLMTAADSVTFIPARDTITIPDSLKDTDPFRYRYYVELKDSLTRLHTRDSLRNIGDSLELHKLDSLIFKDSSETAYRDSIAWFNSLSRRERKKYLAEINLPKMMARVDSILNAKDSIRAYKDSVISATPRILETYAVPDSMQYKRLITWTHDRYFNDVELH